MTEENKKREATEQPEGAPEIKKPKLEAIKTQIEYYLSDQNLKFDQFFHKTISNSEEGWIDLEHFMNCNKIRAMKCTADDVLSALSDSKLEVDTAKKVVRRKEGAVLPPLQERKPFAKKDKRAATLQNDQATGVLAVVRNIPEKVREVDVKKKISEALVESGRMQAEPKKLGWIFKKHGSDAEFALAFEANPALTPQILNGLEFTVETRLKVEVLEGAELQEMVHKLPAHLLKKRRELLQRLKPSKGSQFKFATPVKLGGQEFAGEDLLRKKVKEILLSRSNGEELKEGSGDFLLMMDLIKYHPDPEKKNGVKGIKVDAWQPNSNNTCFHVIKEDGSTDNISMNKCYEKLVEESKMNYEEAKAKKAEVKTETVEAKTEAVETKIEAVETKTEAVETKTETVETKTEAVETKTETAETKTETVETKTETAETKAETAETKAETAEIKTETAEIKTETAETKTETAETKTETAEIKTETAEIKTETAEIKTETAEDKTETAEA